VSDYARLLRMVKPYTGRLLASLLCSFLVGVLSVLLVSLTVSLMGALEGGGLAPATAAAPEQGAAGPASERLPSRLTSLRGDLLGRLQEWIPALPPLARGGGAFFGVGLWVLGLVLLKGVVEFLSDYNMRLLGLWVTLDLREQLYDRVLRQPVSFFWNHPIGQLMSRITGDVGRLQKVVAGELAELLRVGSILVLQVVWVFFLFPDLSFMMAVVLPLIVWPVARFGRKLKKASRRSQERMAEVSALLHETLAGVRVVKAFGAERFERGRFRTALLRMFEPDRKAIKLGALTTPVIDLAGALALASFLAVVGWRSGSGEIDLRTLPGFLAGLTYLFLAAKSLARLNNSLQQGMAAARRVFTLLDLPPEPLEDLSLPALAPFRERVEFSGVRFSYGKREALHGVDLSVEAGQVVALVGPSGAGKTTLVNLLPRFFDPAAGEVRIDGRDIRTVRLTSLRSQIGLVSQDVILFDDTVRRNIAYAVENPPPGAVERAAAAAYADEFIRALPEGYETRLGEGGQKLSAGQRQRLSIARALLKDPPILILDEATSALDSESEALLQAALENLMLDRTVFVIAHRLSTVRRADRIVVLEAGRIVESGSHADLLARGRLYRRLHELQFSDDAPSGAEGARPAVG
jgi:subfamily B ATP-binding cassette protein MsbA